MRRVIRRSPYPPSFRRIAARAIEPATGASTWALGSQRCRPYRGDLARNANVMVNHQPRGHVKGRAVFSGARKESVPVVAWRDSVASSKGRLAEMV